MLRKYPTDLAEDVEYKLKGYTAVRIYDDDGDQMFGEGEDDGEEITFTP